MTGPLIRMTVARRPASSQYPALWWSGACPWPSLPTTDFAFRCCSDDGVLLKVHYVEVHLPRNPGDWVATITLQRWDEDGVQHLMHQHNFGLG
jgi:hypothetical protein